MSKTEPIELEATLDITGETALATLTKAEVDTQIATARAYPRSVTRFKKQALELATQDQDTAESMFYKMPRGKDEYGKQKFIEGPSVRLAEIVATTWGNIRAESDIVDIGQTHVTAMGQAMDLESNTAVRIRVKRRITNSKGVRYNDDMIGTTCNAAMSIAFREAVFKIVPRAMFESIYLQAKSVAVGSSATLADRRSRAIEWFVTQGIPLTRILERLGREGIEDVDLQDLEALTGIRSAVKSGDLSLAKAFEDEEVEDEGGVNKAKQILSMIENITAKKTPTSSLNSTPKTEALVGTTPAAETTTLGTENKSHKETPVKKGASV